MDGTPKTFTCAHCQDTFDKACSDEEAAAEFQELYGYDPRQEENPALAVSILCHDCWLQMGLEYKQ